MVIYQLISEAAARTSQSAVAKEIGCSSALVQRIIDTKGGVNHTSRMLTKIANWSKRPVGDLMENNSGPPSLPAAPASKPSDSLSEALLADIVKRLSPLEECLRKISDMEERLRRLEDRDASLLVRRGGGE